MEASLNCDCGESFGPYTIGEDDKLLPLVNFANIAAGTHGGDWDVMDRTVRLALELGVGIGAHPSLPDRQGFGRRVLHMPPESFFLCLLTQTGALDAVLKLHGAKYGHFKPHGQAYIMSSKDIALARGSAKIAKLYQVPLLGLPGSAHETACREIGADFIPEWYADLLYNDEGGLIPPEVGANPKRKSPEEVYSQTRRMLEDYTWVSASGNTILSFPRDQKRVSICIHSDLSGAIETAMAARKAIDDVKEARRQK